MSTTSNDKLSARRLNRRQILKGAGALGAAGAVAALQATSVLANNASGQSGQSGQTDGRLPGSWLETLTNVVVASGTPIPDFQTLFTYNADGSLVGTASIDLAPGLLSGPTHGAWVRTGRRSFRWKGLAFSFGDDTNASRTLLTGGNGTYIIESSITLNAAASAYSGTGTFKIVDAGGATLVSGTYDLTATRITA